MSFWLQHPLILLLYLSVANACAAILGIVIVEALTRRFR